MTLLNGHLDTETLSAYADGGGELSGDDVARAEGHLSACADCRETLRRVRELVVAAGALPRDLAPPPEAWNVLRDRIAREPRVTDRQPRWWHNGWLASAAAVILVAGTAVVTSTAPKAKAGKLPPAQVVERPTFDIQRSTSNVVLAVDANYAATVDELRRALHAERHSLSPSTIRVLEHAIAVCDAAIAEARAALASDPANAALVDILSAQYERKVDLLQRATKLSHSL